MPIALTKDHNDLFLLPTMRCGVLPYYIDENNTIIWGCVESNRVGPITITRPAGIQDIIITRENDQFFLEVGKPLPDLGYDFFKEFVGKFFRDDLYQKALTALVENKFELFIVDPLTTALQETEEEHGVDLREDVGNDRHLLIRSALQSLPLRHLSGKQGATSESIWLACLTGCDHVLLQNTHKTERKIRRNFGREFYEKGCWLSLNEIKEAFNVEKEKFSTQDSDLIRGVFESFQDTITFLDDMEIKLCLPTSNLSSKPVGLLRDNFFFYKLTEPLTKGYELRLRSQSF